MKSAIASCLLFALALAGAAAAQGPARTPGLRKTPGQAYARLADWAKTHSLQARWLKPEESVELSGASSTVVLFLDSREARVNGVEVWLLFPVVMQDNGVWLTQLDADLTLRPLLWPPRNQSGARVKLICLDPGHGGKDTGNRVGSNQEKRYTLLLAQELRKQLARAGLKVVLTRSGDSFVELADRPGLAKRRKADLFLSLHFNGADNGRNSVQGAEVYCLTPVGASSTNARGEGAGAGWFPGNRNNQQNLFLAYQVQKALTRSLGVEDRGVRRARFAVLRDAMMPGVLIEAGFMSNPVEGRKIFTSAYRQQIARAIVQGVLAYKHVAEGGA